MGRARLSLEGLSIGDAFGERYFVHPDHVARFIEMRALPGMRVWPWTDDTAMALSIVEQLDAAGAIDEDALAQRFADRYRAEPDRGYGPGAHTILTAIAEGTPWRESAGAAFGGLGSYGNGSAMRVAPIGAYFADDLDRVVTEAAASSLPTHMHPEAVAGAIAVAVAAALAGSTSLRGHALLEAVRVHVPESEVRRGIGEAIELGLVTNPEVAASVLGNGAKVSCPDTVPFSLWCASQHVDDMEEALWNTVAGLGDRDTTCAIVGGIVALRVGAERFPSFHDRREPLPL